ncbi:MAG: hypothetical protein ACR2L2_02980 [Acidobacteriota bacterium]
MSAQQRMQPTPFARGGAFDGEGRHTACGIRHTAYGIRLRLRLGADYSD